MSTIEFDARPRAMYFKPLTLGEIAMIWGGAVAGLFVGSFAGMILFIAGVI